MAGNCWLILNSGWECNQRTLELGWGCCTEWVGGILGTSYRIAEEKPNLFLGFYFFMRVDVRNPLADTRYSSGPIGSSRCLI
jgi:hypothetical protein